MSPVTALAPTEMTDGASGILHLVPDTWAAAGHRRGRYHALCRRVVVPGSLSDPPGTPCEDCRSFMETVPR